MSEESPRPTPEPVDAAGFERPDAAGFSLTQTAILTRDRLLRSRFARDVTSLWSAQVAVVAVLGIQGIAVARLLGPRGYGMAGLIASVPGLVFVFLDARSADASIRYLGEFSAQGDTARALAFCKLGFGLDLSVGALSSIVVLAVSPWAAHHLVHAPDAQGLLVLYALGMLLRAPGATAGAAFVTLGRFRLAGALQVASAIGRTALVLVAIGFDRNVSAVIWATAVGLAAEGVAYSLVASRLIRSTWGGSWFAAPLAALRDRRGEIARFLLWSDLGSTLGLAVKQVDVLVVGYFLDPTAAGYYRLALSIGSLAGVLVPPLQSVLYQRFAKLRGARDPAALLDAVKRAAISICAPLAVAGLVGISVVPLAIRVAAGAAYEPAGTAARILVASAALWVGLAWVRPLALTMGEVRLLAATGALVGVLSIIGFAAVTPDHGFVGTAWVRFAVSLVMQGIVAVVILDRHVRTRFAEVGSPVGTEG